MACFKILYNFNSHLALKMINFRHHNTIMYSIKNRYSLRCAFKLLVFLKSNFKYASDGDNSNKNVKIKKMSCTIKNPISVYIDKNKLQLITYSINYS